MKNKQRVLALLLATVFLTSCGSQVEETAVAVPETSIETTLETTPETNTETTEETNREFRYENLPTEWDLTELYADKAAWREDYNRWQTLFSQLPDYRGKLDSAQAVLDFIKEVKEGECNRLLHRLYLYAALGSKHDTTDLEFAEMTMLSTEMDGAFNAHIWYFTQELCELPYERRMEIYNDELLSDYRLLLYFLAVEDPSVSSDETVRKMNEDEAEITAAKNEYYQLMATTEREYAELALSDGTVITLDDDGLNYVYINDPDKAWDAYYAYLAAMDEYREHFFPALIRYMKAYHKKAKDSGTDSVRAYQARIDKLPMELYDKAIETVEKNAPYNSEAISAAGTYYYPENYTYDDIMTDTRNAVSVLGETYTEALDEMVTCGHADVYPKQNRENHSYSYTVTPEVLPYVSFTYGDGHFDSFAHEFGHAVHSSLSGKNQRFVNGNPSIFTSEVASITNELLYLEYMKNKAESYEEKCYYSFQLVGQLTNFMAYSTVNTEFEDYLYKQIEAGEEPAYDELCDVYAGLFAKYFGGSAEDYPERRSEWIIVPTYFFESYYNYKYSLDLCYSVAIVTKISNDEEGAVDNYLEFLKAGNSAEDIELLKMAGIDPLDDATYQYINDYYRDKVSEYEALLEKLS